MSGKHTEKRQRQHRYSNEGKACDAVVKAIEQRTGEARKDIRLPEKDREGPPVELRLKIGPQEYAIEHTQIEAFEEQIGRGVLLERLVGPVEEALCGKLSGPGYYSMTFPSDCGRGLDKFNFRKCQQSLEVWVRDNAQCLFDRVQETIRGKSIVPRKYYRDSITGTPSGFPYEIKLGCQLLGRPSGKKSGLLGAGRMTPEELEALTTCRLRRALNKKLPKLHKCKNEGARTVLVLENDGVLLEPSLVGAALALLHGEFTGKLPFPDEIYFTETSSRDGTWFVWLMECDGQRSSSQDWTRCTEFRADELTDLTA